METTEQERKWLSRAKRLFKDTPKGCWLFAADGNLHLMRYKKGSERAILPGDGMDQEYIIGTLSGPEIDGGDW